MKRTYVYDNKLGRMVEIGEYHESTPLKEFQPYYDSVLRSWVTSPRDQAKKMKSHKNYSHPDGLAAVQDDKAFVAECKRIKANRLDYLRQNYGDNYVKHKMETDAKFREKNLRGRGSVFGYR